MGSEIPKDIDRARIEEHAQRLAEQAALRKVRKTLDRIEQSEGAERRTLRRILIVFAILVALGLGYLWWLAGGKDRPAQSPMQVPATLPQKQ